MERKKFDIVVVGAGPAGAIAAQYAAKGGLNVALLERKKNVGLPVRCGEGVGFKGMLKSVAVEKHWIQTKINNVTMVSPSGLRVSFKVHGDDRGCIVNREIMDPDLVKRAQKAGVSYFSETSVISVRKELLDRYICFSTDMEFEAGCLILADGVESKCARDLGWDTALSMDNIETCAICRVAHESIIDDTVEFYLGNEIAPGGFVWIFPRGKGVANVGIGIIGSKSSPGKPRDLLKKIISDKFGDVKVTDMHSAGVPVARWLKPLVKDGVMVVGDAARQVTCYSGGGIAYALYAGRTAGETAAEAFDNGKYDYKHLLTYQKKWSLYCGKQQVRSYLLKKLMQKKTTDEFLDNVAKSLLKGNTGKLTYMRVFACAFIRHPIMLLRIFLLFR